jgi:hypothetical protein
MRIVGLREWNCGPQHAALDDDCHRVWQRRRKLAGDSVERQNIFGELHPARASVPGVLDNQHYPRPEWSNNWTQLR